MERMTVWCLALLIQLIRLILVCATEPAHAAAVEIPTWPRVAGIERQPLRAQLKRLSDALEQLGSPLSAETLDGLRRAENEPDDTIFASRVQDILDPLCLAAVDIDDETLVAVPGAAAEPAELIEQGWRAYLVKVVNWCDRPCRVRVDSRNARPLPRAPAAEVPERWLGLSWFEGAPLGPSLSGLPLEYRIVESFARDPGERSAELEFSVERQAAPGDERPEEDPARFVQQWRFDQDLAGWRPQHQVKLGREKESLVVEPTGNDPYLVTDLAKPAPAGRLVLRFWGRSAKDGVGQLFWWTAERPHPDGEHLVNFAAEGGRARLYEIPFAAEADVTGIRLDPAGATRIDWLELAVGSGAENHAKVTIPFLAQPATPLTFVVFDDEDRPAMACFEITDSKGRVYPAQSKRLAPDFFFQRQIYRTTGETIALPPGEYTVRASRGPESLAETRQITVGREPQSFEYRVRRWIDPSRRGYWSGDHHIHAAGCAHYDQPTEGVLPADMLRHCLGEDLKVGCCLTWGPCFDYQKRFFSGRPDDVSQYPYLLRYDVEVSGFGSHASGHLNLLRLTEQIPPGGISKDHWPTLGLNTLRWAKRQGAVCGPAHSSIGLTRMVDRVPGTEGLDGPRGLPTFDVPAYDGIGANEFIMNVAHEVPGPDGEPIPAVDFISTMNTDRTAELNMWYHVLNCGFRVRASGETDFPCVSAERVGLGRVYARLDGPLDFDRWCDALAAGRSYVSDGSTHLMEFTIRPAGEAGMPLEAGTSGSELRLPEPATLEFTVQAAGRYDDGRPLTVELVVDGYPKERQEIPSDGTERKVVFSHRLERSGWAAVRVFPHAHTNPVFVEIGGQPIRANGHSAEWCLRGVEECWKSKQATYRADEQATAQADYDHAREVFGRRLAESP